MGELMGTVLEGEAASLRDEIADLRRQLGEANGVIGRASMWLRGTLGFHVDCPITDMAKRVSEEWHRRAYMEQQHRKVREAERKIAALRVLRELAEAINDGEPPSSGYLRQRCGLTAEEWHGAGELMASLLCFASDKDFLAWHAAELSESEPEDIVAALQAEVERLRKQIPHPGDGSCDGCGKVPSVDIPTRLCPDCIATQADYERLREALHDIAGGHTSQYVDAPDVMTAESPAAFQHDMWTWSQKVARSVLATTEGEKE